MKRTIRLGSRQVDYELQRKKVKNINLRIRRDGTVYVSASRFVPQPVIDAFLASNSDKILAALERMSSLTACATKSCDDGEGVYYLGKSYVLRVVSGSRGGAEICGNEIVLTVRDTGDEKMRRRTFEKWLRARCLEKTEEICRRMYPDFAACGIPWPEIKFRRMKSCWGSCQPQKKIITFNTALIAVDESCIECVVAHEFTHFLYQNHSRDFYAQLAVFIPDWRRCRSKLKEYAAVI